ncbi:MAG: RNA-binding S4 domain-containing protein [Tissierellaceae bacterium]|nr:RNA-binding S4 domain-containing protein [Tissierellaceae bacterium]
MEKIRIETEYIKLDQFLKHAGIVQTGGQAKILISQGNILVNNEVVYERGKKLRKNDIIEIIDSGSFTIL